MNIQEQFAIDSALCRALGKLPGESLVQAARRIMICGAEGPRRMAAAALLDPGGWRDPWECMRRAYECIKDLEP